jgi:hypothetical protein
MGFLQPLGFVIQTADRLSVRRPDISRQMMWLEENFMGTEATALRTTSKMESSVFMEYGLLHFTGGSATSFWSCVNSTQKKFDEMCQHVATRLGYGDRSCSTMCDSTSAKAMMVAKKGPDLAAV